MVVVDRGKKYRTKSEACMHVKRRGGESEPNVTMALSVQNSFLIPAYIPFLPGHLPSACM